MGFNPTSDLLLGILCLVGVIYIGPSIIAAYISLSKPPRTDLENIEEGVIRVEGEERKVEKIDMLKGIEQAENFEQVDKFENVENSEEVESFENVGKSERVENSEEFNDFDNDGEMVKGRRPREETYTLVPIRAKDDEWEIV